MPATFEITTGKLFNPSGALVGVGYSGGDCGKFPEGKNNPAFCNVHDKGPLPEGLYTMGEPVEHSQLGPFAIPLAPDPSNTMFGRSGFFMHGDTIENPGNASDGCIIQERAVRNNAKSWSDQQIQVVAVKQ